MEKIKCTKCDDYNSATSKYCSSCGFELPNIKAEPVSIGKNLNIRTKRNYKKLIGIVAGAITFLIAYNLTQQFLTPSLDKQLVKMANEMNKNCPMMIDQYTRLDNTHALPNKTVQYNYTLVEIEKTEFNLDTVRKYFEPNIINNLKTNPDMKDLRDNNVTFNYSYRDKNGEFVWKLEISPEMYNDY